MNKRIEWVDIAKGIGIILVILGHTISPCNFRMWIYSFHLPLFFFLSGYFFKPELTTKEFIIKRVKSILLPYITFGLLIVIFDTLINRDLIGNLIKMILQQRNTSLWFLSVLLLLNILYYLIFNIFKLQKKYYAVLIITIFLTIFGLVLNRFGINKLFWNIDAVLTTSIFFYFGFLLKTNSRSNDIIFKGKSSVVIFIVSMVINFLGVVISIKHGQGLEIWHSWYGIEPITYITALAGILYTIIASYHIHLKFLKYLGENSLVYFALHQSIILVLVNKTFSIIGINYKTGILYAIISILKVILIIAIITPINLIINKTFLRKTIGK